MNSITLSVIPSFARSSLIRFKSSACGSGVAPTLIVCAKSDAAITATEANAIYFFIVFRPF